MKKPLAAKRKAKARAVNVIKPKAEKPSRPTVLCLKSFKLEKPGLINVRVENIWAEKPGIITVRVESESEVHKRPVPPVQPS